MGSGIATGWSTGSITKMPSEYFREHIYMTFQDDWVALQVKDLCNVRRLMWASDFPHSDSTWPNSESVLTKQMAHLPQEERDLILHDNVAELFGVTASFQQPHVDQPPAVAAAAHSH